MNIDCYYVKNQINHAGYDGDNFIEMELEINTETPVSIINFGSFKRYLQRNSKEDTEYILISHFDRNNFIVFKRIRKVVIYDVRPIMKEFENEMEGLIKTF